MIRHLHLVNEQLDWQQAGGLAAGLIVVSVALRFGRRRWITELGAYAQEAGIIAALYSLWQYAAEFSVMNGDEAVDRAVWISRTEQDWGLPSERSVQALILSHPNIEVLANLYYASMHFTLMGVFLVWLFVRHRDRYPVVRSVLAVATAACLLIQLIPVAPPRLVPQLGVIDMPAKFGQSVYALGLDVDEYSAMPSVHIAWSMLIGFAVVYVSRSRWRWLALLHPAITWFVVLTTGNHFWADGLVASALDAAAVGVVVLVVRLIARIRARMRPAVAAPPAVVPELQQS